MNITSKDVQHLASLARLNVEEGDLSDWAKELASILDYVERMQKVDTADVEPFCLSAQKDGWREDVDQDCEDVARTFILQNFPKQLGGLLSAPGVFKQSKS